jgi:hypothetical protein
MERKWSSLSRKEASSLLAGLMKKAEDVRWRNDTRSAHYCLVGAGMKKRE